MKWGDSDRREGAVERSMVKRASCSSRSFSKADSCCERR